MKDRWSIVLLMCFTASWAAACSSGGAVTRSGHTAQEIVEMKAAETIGGNPEELLVLAEYYLGRQKFDEAMGNVNRVIASHEGTIHMDRARFLKGRIYADILNFHMDLDKAAAAFRMVIASPPESEFDDRARNELKIIEERRRKR